jgi:hypothetical protein
VDFSILKLALDWAWAIVLAVAGWVWKDSQKKEDALAALDKRLHKLESEAVKEEKVKAIIKEVLQSYFEETHEMKRDLKAIAENVVNLRIDVAAMNAARSGSANDKRER